jgi:hypothetical protein
MFVHVCFRIFLQLAWSLARMSTKLLLSILLEPLSAILRGFWVDAGQPSPDEPWYATFASIYIGFVKVPILWRLHMVLRFVKYLHSRDAECPQTPQRSRIIEMVHSQCIAGHPFVAVSPRLDSRTHLPEGNFQTKIRGPYKAAVAHILIRNQLSNFLDGGISGHHPRLLVRHYPVSHCGLQFVLLLPDASFEASV